MYLVERMKEIDSKLMWISVKRNLAITAKTCYCSRFIYFKLRVDELRMCGPKM